MKKTLIGLILLLNSTAQLRSMQLIPYSLNPTAEDNEKLKKEVETHFPNLTPPPFSRTNRLFVKSNFTDDYANFKFPEHQETFFLGASNRLQQRINIKETAILSGLFQRAPAATPVLTFVPLFDDVKNKTYLLLGVNPAKEHKDKQAIGFLIYNALPNYNNDWPENKEIALNEAFHLIQENIDISYFDNEKRIIRCCQHYPTLHHNHYYTLAFADALCRGFQDEKELYYFLAMCDQEYFEKAKIIISQLIRKNFPSFLPQENNS